MSYDNPAPPTYQAYGNPPYAVPAGTPYIVQTGSNLNAAFVRDYLAWSIVNLFCGWGFGGIIPLIFSLMCRNCKNVNDYNGAQTMSTLALIFNILITVGGLIGWITFIVFISIYLSY